MPYLTKIYDFPGDTYDDPALVPRELADEVFQWLEKRSTGLNGIRAQELPNKVKQEENFQKVFLAP